DAGGVAAPVVDLGGGNSPVAAHIQLNGPVLADGHRRDGITHRNDGRAGGAVAVIIGEGEGDGVGADVADIKGGFVQAQVGNAAGVGAAIVDRSEGDRGGNAGIYFDG